MHGLRFRSGQVHLVSEEVAAESVIEAGDLVWLDGSEARAAAEFEWNTNLATTQSDFAAVFLGVAHEPSGPGETRPISVDLSPASVYEFEVATGSYGLGDALGPDEDSGSLMSQKLEGAAAGSAIARACEMHSGTVSRLRVSFASAFHPGSANVNASLG